MLFLFSGLNERLTTNGFPPQDARTLGTPLCPLYDLPASVDDTTMTSYYVEEKDTPLLLAVRTTLNSPEGARTAINHSIAQLATIDAVTAAMNTDIRRQIPNNEAARTASTIYVASTQTGEDEPDHSALEENVGINGVIFATRPRLYSSLSEVERWMPMSVGPQFRNTVVPEDAPRPLPPQANTNAGIVFPEVPDVPTTDPT